MNTSILTMIHSGFWWILLLGITIFFSVYSFILIFHWFKFAMNKPVALMASMLYLGFGLLLILILLGITLKGM